MLRFAEESAASGTRPVLASRNSGERRMSGLIVWVQSIMLDH